METTILEALVLAASGSVAFGSMLLVILLLMSPWRWRSGVAYALGYSGGYLLLGLLTLFIGARATLGGVGTPPRWLGVLWGLLGVLLLWLAWRNARRPATAKPEPPRFFQAVERITPRRACGLGLLVSIINIKNLGLFLSAQSVVVFSPLSLTAQVALTVAVAAVFSSAVWIPLVLYALSPQQAEITIVRIKTWLETHSRALGIWLPLLFGIIFLIKGGRTIL